MHIWGQRSSIDVCRYRLIDQLISIIYRLNDWLNNQGPCGLIGLCRMPLTQITNCTNSGLLFPLLKDTYVIPHKTLWGESHPPSLPPRLPKQSPVAGNRNKRTMDAVTHIGPAVLNGCVSTFLSIILLADSNSTIFEVFFKVKGCTILYRNGR